jgi:hypothetical protein
MPCPVFPEITLRSAALVPPITVLVDSSTTCTPSFSNALESFGGAIADVPVGSVPT